MGVDEDRKLGGATLRLWSPADIRSNANGMTALVDGGAVDNIALLPLLRRKVKNIICHVAAVAPASDPNYVGHVWWPSCFGCATIAPKKVGVENLNERTQVFE